MAHRGKSSSEERGVSEVVGVILIIGLIVAVFASYYPIWRQAEVRRLEAEHMDAVRHSFSDLKLKIEDLEASGSRSIDIKLGRDTVAFLPDPRKAGSLSVSPANLITMRMYPSDDAYVFENSPDNNFGTETSLRVATVSDNNKRAFLKFSLENIPLGATILKADLWLYCDDYRSPFKDVTDVRIYSVDDDGWSENGLTWRNQPLMKDALDSLYVDKRGWISLTVKDFVIREYQRDKIMGLGLRMKQENYDGTERYLSFYSKEAGDKRPYLEVTYVTIGLGEWVQTDWSGGATYPTLEVGTWDNQYNRYFNGENINSGLPGELRLENASPTAYKLRGFIESSIYDTGGAADWWKINWSARTPSGVDVSYTYVRGEDVFEGGTTGISGAQADDGVYENIYEKSYKLPIAFDAASSKSGDDSSFTWVHTTSGSNRILFVGVSFRNDGDQIVVSVTYGKNSLTFLRADTNGREVRTEVWYLINPPLGSNAVTVTLSKKAKAVCGAISYTGIDQNNPIDNHRGTIGSGTIASASVTVTTENSWVMAVLAQRRDGTNITSDTKRYDDISPGPAPDKVRGTGADKNAPQSTGSKSISFTLSSPTTWAESIISFRPATVYRMNVEHRITSLPEADDYELQIEYYTAGDLEAVSVYAFNFSTGGWDNLGTIRGGSAANPNLFTYNLTGTNYISGGNVYLRYVQPDNDATQTILMIDYCRVKTEALRLTGVTVLTRTGGTENADDGTWSDWENCTDGGDVPSPDNRYIQYRVYLWTESDQLTPVLEEITISYIKPWIGASAYGTFEFSAINDFYPSQTYVYEGGGVILLQDGVDLMVSGPAVVAASDAEEGFIRVDVSFIVIKNKKASIASTGTVTVQASCESSRHVVAPVEGPNRENVTITIPSIYSGAWGRYMQNLKEELNEKGYNASLDGLTLTILGKNRDPAVKDIYYYERIKEIEVIIT